MYLNTLFNPQIIDVIKLYQLLPIERCFILIKAVFVPISYLLFMILNRSARFGM
jgi:hypothetical protein